MPAALAHPALRYYGGKARLAPWILAHFPPLTCYVEPFGGAASVLLQKPPARHEVYNDLSLEVVDFFRVLRERPADLIRAIQCTPFARAEVDLACAQAAPEVDEVERARRLYVRAWQGRHGLPARGRMGWRFERATSRSRTVLDDWCDPSHLWHVAERFRHVQIECDDALRVIARFDGPDSLTYVDPPYPAGTRSARWARRAYPQELDEDGHRRLATVLYRAAGMVVISGYTCPLYEELYTGWTRVTRLARTHGSQAATEALWLSPHTVERLAVRQLPLLEPVQPVELVEAAR